MNGSVREHMETYGIVRKAYGMGVKGLCDCKYPLTILFSQFLLCCLNAFLDSKWLEYGWSQLCPGHIIVSFHFLLNVNVLRLGVWFDF